MNNTLRGALTGLFEAFGDHLTDGWHALPYAGTCTNSVVTLTLLRPPAARTPGSPTKAKRPVIQGPVIQGHLSAWKQLAGRYWAATQAPPWHTAVGTQLPTLLARPGNGAVSWSPMSALLDDPRVTDYLRFLKHFLRHQRCVDEARLCSWSTRFSRGRLHTGAPALALKQALKAKGRLSTLAGIKLMVPFISSPNAIERLSAIAQLLELLVLSSPTNSLTCNELLMRHVAPLWNDPQPLVQEAAVALAERWTPTLIARKAFAEARPMLDTLIDYGVAVADNLRQRYQCHLVLGNDTEAAHDWKRLQTAYRTNTSVQLMGFEHGTLAEFQALALTLAADAQLCFAERSDPCTERKLTAKQKTDLDQPTVYRNRARSFLEAALAIVKQSTSVAQETTGKGFRGRTYGVYGRLLEQEGDIASAAQHYRQANELLVAGGIAWHRYLYRDKAIALETRSQLDHPRPAPQPDVAATAAVTSTLPRDFDGDWLLAEATSDDHIAEASSAWGNPWAPFPHHWSEATATPLTVILIEKFGPIGLDWNLVRTLGLAEYKTYDQYTATNAAIVRRYQNLIDQWHPQHAYERWDGVFTFKRISDIFGLRGDGRQDAAPHGKQDLRNWLEGLLHSKDNTAESVLRELPQHVLERMETWYREAGPGGDFEHFLVWCVWEKTRDPQLVRATYALHRPLFRNTWGRIAAPPKDYLGLAAPWKRTGTPELTLGLRQFIDEFGKPGPYDDDLFAEKWLWPWALLWHPDMGPLLVEHLAGKWDHKPLQRTRRARRLDLYQWLVEQVDDPQLRSAYERARDK